MRAIFAVDPGSSTGLAWGVFNDRAETVQQAIADRLDPTDSMTIEGPELDQAQSIFNLWQEFKQDCVRTNLLPPAQVDLVIEEFILIPGAHAGGKEGIRSARVGWAFEGYRQGRMAKFEREKHLSEANWQHPNAMRHEQRLKTCGVWVRGREHERSAWCHIYAHLLKIIK